MATKAAEGSLDFGGIVRVMNIAHRMTPHWMPNPVFQLEAHNLLPREVVFGQLHFALKERYRMRAFVGRMSRNRSVAFRAKRVLIGEQQLRPVASVRIVARCAPLAEYRLVEYALVL